MRVNVRLLIALALIACVAPAFAEEAKDHYKCYDAKPLSSFNGPDVDLVDRFGPTLADVVKLDKLCTPVDKNGEGMVDPNTHLACYSINDDPDFADAQMEIWNQFGEESLRITRAGTLCVPTVIDGETASGAVDHFKCYRGGTKFDSTIPYSPRDVSAVDRFRTNVDTAEAPVAFCNPVDKNGEGIGSTKSHLECYNVEDRALRPLNEVLNVTNQFGSQRIILKRQESLCVPTRTYDHYTCYGAVYNNDDFQVSLTDEFGNTTATVTKADKYCVPANKKNEGLADADTGLTCYTINDPADVNGLLIDTNNQFGDEILRLNKARTLCVPTKKVGSDSHLDIEHVKCYQARSGRDDIPFNQITVPLTDEYSSDDATLIDPVSYCTIVDKNGEGARFDAARLECYDISDSSIPPLDIRVDIENQFGEQNLLLKRRENICVPTRQR
ncbi:hypothetical protein ABI59_03245 [Acidobacteria bacterium Mor1]|nr:hypothetical protein ABI59_03245 [Acidobacteria bacterium Mor1]